MKQMRIGVLVLAALVALAGCFNPVGPGDAGDGSGDGGGGGGAGGGSGTGSGSFEIPGGLESTPDELGLVYYGDWFDNGTYNTDVQMAYNLSLADLAGSEGPFNYTDVDLIYFEMVDATDSLALDETAYTVLGPTDDQGDPPVHSVSTIDFYVDADFDDSSEPTSIAYYATNTSGIGEDDVIVGGTVTVSRDGSEYTFDFDLDLEGGGSLTGSFSGIPAYEIDDAG